MVGYRTWGVRYHIEKGSFVLYGPFSEIPWERDMKAICGEGNLEKHLKEMVHSCGLYSYKSPDALFKKWGDELFFATTPPLAIGAVHNYGIVAVYSTGFRSSHCLIDTIFLSPQLPCRKCQGESKRTPAEFLTVTYSPHFPEGYHGIPYLVCPYHYYSLKGEFIEGYTRVFPIEAIRMDLEENYQVPVKDLGDLF